MIHVNRHLKWPHILCDCEALVALSLSTWDITSWNQVQYFADMHVTKVLHFLWSIRVQNCWTKGCMKDGEWCRCKSHCGACPDEFIPFPYRQKFSCHGYITKVLDAISQLFEKNHKDSQVTNPLCENTGHFKLKQMAWLQYPCWYRLLPLLVLFQLVNENAFNQIN